MHELLVAQYRMDCSHGAVSSICCGIGSTDREVKVRADEILEVTPLSGRVLETMQDYKDGGDGAGCRRTRLYTV